MRFRFFATSAACAALLFSGLSATVALGDDATPRADGGSSPAPQTVGPWSDPSDPDVDEATLIAIPRAGVPSRLLEAAVDDASSDATMSLHRAGQRMQIVEIDAGEDSGEDIAADLVDSGLFEAVDYNRAHTPAYRSNPNDPYFGLPGTLIGLPFTNQWEMGSWPGANFAAAWPRLGGFGAANSAPVAVVDTGCDLSHPDHGANIVAGYDFGQDRSSVAPLDLSNDETYHGSAVASLIASQTDNGVGMAGAAWDNTVICYKATDAKGDLWTFPIVDSMMAAAAKGAKVINLSLSSSHVNAVEKWVVEEVIGQGVVVVASAGNDAVTPADPGGPVNAVNYPAAYDGVISVGATDPWGDHAAFSNNNPGTHVDLAAPGNAVLAWEPGPDYGLWDGTSFSAPLVSAAAALVLRARPGLAPAAVKDILTSTAVRAPGGYNSKFGWGILDANAAVTKALATATPAWFTPHNDGVFGVQVGVAFTHVLGIGGNPAPTARLAAGSALPAGVQLVDQAGVGWVLTGTISTPGSYTASVEAVQNGAVAVARTITVHASGCGDARFNLRFASTIVGAGERGRITLTVQPLAPGTAPSGWYDLVDSTTKAVLTSGTWATGESLIFFYAPEGVRRLQFVAHGFERIPWSLTIDLSPITVTKTIGNKVAASLAKKKVTLFQKGKVTFKPAAFAPSSRGTLEVVDGKTKKTVARASWASKAVTVKLPRLKLGKHPISLKIAIDNGPTLLLGAGTLTVTKVKPTIKFKATGTRVAITVKAKGVAAVKGKITVKAGSKARKVALKKGRATVTLPRGKTKVKVTFTPTKKMAKKVSKTTASKTFTL